MPPEAPIGTEIKPGHKLGMFEMVNFLGGSRHFTSVTGSGKYPQGCPARGAAGAFLVHRNMNDI